MSQDLHAYYFLCTTSSLPFLLSLFPSSSLFSSLPPPSSLSCPSAPAPVMCEVCGTYFETRRGLSSHARLHLRQLGVAVSDNSGAPIDLLYQLIQDRDGSMHPPKPVYSSPKKPKGSGTLISQKESPLGGRAKVMTTPQNNISKVARKGTVLAKPRQSSMSSFLTAGKSPSPSGGASLASAKPAWAPQETDAPLTLGKSQPGCFRLEWIF